MIGGHLAVQSRSRTRAIDRGCVKTGPEEEVCSLQRIREAHSKSGQFVDEPHVFSCPLQVPPKSSAAGDEVSEFLKRI